MQSIPLIATEAEQLTVFQRTPNFSIPARNGPISDERLALAVARGSGEAVAQLGAVARQAVAEGVARVEPGIPEAAVRDAMWEPAYLPYRPADA